MSEADEDDLKIHKANVQKADSVEIYGPEDLEDYTDHGRTGSYDLDHTLSVLRIFVHIFWN